MNTQRVVLILLLAVVATACSSKKNTREPTELKDIANPAVHPRTDWTTDAGDGADGQPSGLRLRIETDAVFSADVDGRVYAFSRKNGDTTWRTDTRTRIVSGPTVEGDMVLVGTRDAQVIALKRSDGKEMWRSVISSEVIGAPVSDGQTVVARALDGKIYGLSADKGDRLWTFDRVVPNLVLRGVSTPLLAGNHAIVGMDNGRVASLRLADGQPLWEQAVAVPSGRTELERLTDIDADLLEAPECVLVASFGGDVACLADDSGDIVWRRSVKSYSGMAMSQDKVFVTDESGVVWALDLHTGAAAWKQEDLLYRKLSPPAYFGGFVVVGDFEGYLHWLDPATGAIVGRSKDGSSAILAPMVATDDRLYIMNSEGRIASVELPAKKK